MNKSTNNVDIDKYQVDRGKQVKIVILAIIACIACGFMAVWLFGNREGLPTTFEFDESITSVVLVQDTDGENSKATRAEISFVSGDSLSVYHDAANGKETIECEIIDGVLTISLDTKKDTLPDFFSSNSSEIIVEIPAGTSLDSFTIKADLAYVEIDGLDLGDFKLDGDEVVMYVFDSNMTKTDISNELGNIYMYDTNVGALSYDGGTTNPEFKYCTFDTMDVYIAFGNLLVCDAYITSVNLTADMGYVDMTNITLAENFYAYADYGAVVLSLVGDPADYILECYISESGKYYLDENLAEGTDESLQQLTIKTYIGDIDVSFVG